MAQLYLSAASVLDVQGQTVKKAQASLNKLQWTRILVKDPPRDQLPAGPAEDSAFLLTRFPGHLNATLDSHFYLTPPGESHVLVQKSPRRHRVRMAKKRRSLQSLFIPSFLTAPPSPTTGIFNVGRSRSASQSTDHSVSNTVDPFNVPVDSPRDPLPPDFLLDDDPFANLSAAPAIIYPTPSPTPTPTPITPSTPVESPPPTPRSPLTPNPDFKPSFLSSPPPVNPLSMPGVSRTLSGRVRPAYSKPAFAPRPSLPSLDTLARMNIVLAKKVRKGRVGARLPFEPWDQPDADQSSGESSTQSQSSSTQCTPLTTPSEEFESLNFSDSDDDTMTTEMDDSSTFTTSPIQGPSTLPTNQDDFFYNADSELSLDSLDDDYTSSELSYLSRSRSTSVTSSSSIGSPEYQWPSFGDNSAESDFLSSSPDDFDFPQSDFDSHNIISSYWSSDDLLDSLGGDVSASALYSDLLSESDMKHEPGTSAGTIRPSTTMHRDMCPSELQLPVYYGDELVDGSGRENAYHGGTHFGGVSGGSRGSSTRRTNGNGMGGDGRASGSGTRRFGGRGDDEDEDKRRRVNRSLFSSDSEVSVSDDPDEDSTDDYGEPVPAEVASSDDDVPLAQRIPTALQAQDTIRRQVREEREQRRAARAAKAEETSSASSRPPGAGQPTQRSMMSSTQEAALHASRSLCRPGARTLPAEAQPFSPDDLARRLQSMEVAQPSPSTGHLSRSHTTSRRDPASKSTSISRPESSGHGLKDQVPSPLLPSATIGSPTDHRPLRPSRSFRRPEGRRIVDEHHAVPLPVDASRKLARSLTRKEEGSSPRMIPTRIPDDNSPKPLSRRSGEEARKLVKQTETRSTRSSSELERPRRLSLTRPPVPPLPAEALAASSSPPNVRGPVIQQRIFIGDMQRFNTVEIGPSTNAGDVIEMVEAQGSLKGWVGSGDWMVWEVAQDFGMERNVLFSPKPASGNAGGSAGALSRSGTRKMSSAHRPVVQPLLSGVAAPLTIAQQLHNNDVFEPGTLLGKHA
ncbi:hypothetical protein C0991_012418 [Blastosporella zonata]|nr:hypothetical protein C0991_012418 [Blastosporella zonata]